MNADAQLKVAMKVLVVMGIAFAIAIQVVSASVMVGKYVDLWTYLTTGTEYRGILSYLYQIVVLALHWPRKKISRATHKVNVVLILIGLVIDRIMWGFLSIIVVPMLFVLAYDVAFLLKGKKRDKIL